MMLAVTLSFQHANGQTSDPANRLIVHQLSSDDPAVRAAGIATIGEQLKVSPRPTASRVQQLRLLDVMSDAGEFSAVADIALGCINAEPDRTDRVEYFLTARIHALLRSQKNEEALADSKSLYNVSLLKSLPVAVQLVAQCLIAARPDHPGYGARFKLQQLVAVSIQPLVDPDIALGDPVLRSVHANENEFPGAGLATEGSYEWRSIGRANILLLTDHCSEAKSQFERSVNSSSPQIAAAAHDGIARAMKAETESSAAANAYLAANLSN
jgi:hypothetical protein